MHFMTKFRTFHSLLPNCNKDYKLFMKICTAVHFINIKLPGNDPFFPLTELCDTTEILRQQKKSTYYITQYKFKSSKMFQ